MIKKRFKELINKLDMFNMNGKPFISPMLNSWRVSSSPNTFIKRDMDLSELSEGELYFVHARLHQFYALGNKTLTKEDIRELHKKVSKLIHHTGFDRLDRVTKDAN